MNKYLVCGACALLLHSLMLSLVSSSTNLNDQMSLLAFKHLITSDPGDILATNWTTTTSFCNWFGVTCSPRRERVTALSLFNMSLQGSISPSIGNLSFLVSLDLESNQLEGTIPLAIFQCRELQRLALSQNKFTGNIPQQLAQLPELQVVSLSRNSFTGSIPEGIGNLTKLRELYLGFNNLTGSIPSSIANISTLELIGCRENSIQGEIPHALENLLNITQLDFDLNSLTGEIPDMIFNISSLKYIAFTANRLSGTIPTSTGLRLPNLLGLFLADNRLSGNFPISISNASKLVELELSNNLFTGAIPNNLGNLRQLEFLNLQNNLLSNDPSNSELDFLTSLAQCRNLMFLVLGGNRLDGALPSSVGNLSASIQMFNMEDAQIKGNIPLGIGNLSNMITLVLNNNELSGSIPSTIGQLKKLQRMHLMNNQLQGHIPNEICQLNQLGELHLRKGNISGSIPNCIGNLSRLSIIQLQSNRLTSMIPASFWTLTDLVFVNLSRNSLEKNLSSEVGNLKVAEEIDLSWNEIMGYIPNTIGQLTSLRSLILSHNLFQGSIPRSFSNLMILELVDLSSNALSGSVPIYFQNFSHLRSLNLSFNQLTGEIPNGGIFTNLTAQSFMGNEGLCGVSRLQVPRCVTNTPQKTVSRTRLLKYVLPAIAAAILLLCFLMWWIRSCRIKKEQGQGQGALELQSPEAHKMISYHELVKATNNFSKSNLLGRGSFSSVYKALLSDGTTSAVKVLDLNREGALKSFDVECKVISNIRHRNLLKIITTCSNLEFRALILQYMPNRSLEYWLHSFDYCLDLPQRISVSLDVAMALDYLHNDYPEPVVHCDLKPSNILFDEDMVAHVADFGITKILAENNSATETKTLGTIGYIAPEYGSEGRVSTSCDVYSYGIVLMETFTGKRPTDDMFTDGWSLRPWVDAFHPNKVMEIVDTRLSTNEKNLTAIMMRDCLSSIIQLALECSRDFPEDRLNMKEVVLRLKKIQGEALAQVKSK